MQGAGSLSIHWTDFHSRWRSVVSVPALRPSPRPHHMPQLPTRGEQVNATLAFVSSGDVDPHQVCPRHDSDTCQKIEEKAAPA